MRKFVYLPPCWMLVILLICPTGAFADKASERVECLRRLRTADHAVVGVISDVVPRLERNRYGDVLIVSRVYVDVTERLRGRSQAHMSFDAEGGTLNGYTMKVSDMPELRRGHRALFLLRDEGQGTVGLTDRGAGILPLTKDDRIVESELSLDDVRDLARQVAR